VLVVEALSLTGSTGNIDDDTGTPIEQVDSNDTPLYFQHDQLDSTRLLTD
jgi:hypothetical protein